MIDSPDNGEGNSAFSWGCGLQAAAHNPEHLLEAAVKQMGTAHTQAKVTDCFHPTDSKTIHRWGFLRVLSARLTDLTCPR
jgi:hypothetical protein